MAGTDFSGSAVCSVVLTCPCTCFSCTWCVQDCSNVNAPVPMGLGVRRAILTCLVCLFQWDLVCDSQWKLAMAQSMYMLGFLIGCIFFGNLSDV